MSDMIAWIAAEAERPGIGKDAGVPCRRGRGASEEELSGITAHQFPGRVEKDTTEERSPLPAKDAGNGAPGELFGQDEVQAEPEKVREQEQERQVYRGRTVAMLRRYMRYSIEAGRLPSLLGSEFFRAKVTAYTVVTFEDRVIFVHDMETCLERLDEFSRQLIARHILQEHDQAATGRLLQCTERTVRTYVPIVLDLLSEILLEVGLMKRLDSNSKNSCQGGLESQKSVRD